MRGKSFTVLFSERSKIRRPTLSPFALLHPNPIHWDWHSKVREVLLPLQQYFDIGGHTITTLCIFLINLAKSVQLKTFTVMILLY